MSKKNFCLLQILIVSMLVICLLVNTFAWSNRKIAYGSEMELDYVAPVNGTTATIARTEVCIDDVWMPLVDSGTGTPPVFHVSNNYELKFRTVVQNHSDDAVPCNVSLFLNFQDRSVPNFKLRVTSPTQEERDVYDAYGWVRVFTSCHVDVLDVVDGIPEEVVFEWSMIFNSDATFIINNDNIELEHF